MSSDLTVIGHDKPFESARVLTDDEIRELWRALQETEKTDDEGRPVARLDATLNDAFRMDFYTMQRGEFIQRDMVAVRVSPDQRPAIVGSPAYFAEFPKPSSPHDLLQHRCINYRHGSGEVYRWELDKGDQSLAVSVNGPLITNDVGLPTRAALDGVGLAFMSDEQAAPHVASGALVRVLEDWCPPFPGFFLYYPSRRQHPAALTALIDTLRLHE